MYTLVKDVTRCPLLSLLSTGWRKHRRHYQGDTPPRDTITGYLCSRKSVSLPNKYLSVFTLMYILLFVNYVTLLKASEFHISVCVEINRCFIKIWENEDSYGNSLSFRDATYLTKCIWCCICVVCTREKERERENNFLRSYSLIKVMANLLWEIKRKLYGIILELLFLRILRPISQLQLIIFLMKI